MVNLIKTLLSDANHSYVSAKERTWLLAFETHMEQLGFKKILIGDFDRWGNDTVAFIKPNVKAKTYIVKISFDGQSVGFRLYCRNVQKHQSYIESAPKHIHEIFTSDIGNCAHCAVGGSVKTDGSCSHRKAYTIHGTQYAKCDGKVFYVPDFSRYPVEDLVSLIRQIYPQKG